MSTVAEGVEEPAQVKVLEAEGCDIVQGYYVAKPLPADQVLHFALTWTGLDRARAPHPAARLLAGPHPDRRPGHLDAGHGFLTGSRLAPDNPGQWMPLPCGLPASRSTST